MKKHLVTFLSMIGLAGSTAPSQAQVLKGATNEKSKTAAESRMKRSKQNTEANTTQIQMQDKRKDKWAKADAEHKATQANLQNKNAKNETWVKGDKTAAEKKAVKSQSNLKLQQEMLHKQSTANGNKNALTKAALTKAKGTQQ